jgi:hypothetical protein
MHRSDVEGLDPTRQHWVPAVVAPRRDWPGAPGCRRGARFMVDARTLRASRDEFEPFDSQSTCLRWIMLNRLDLNRTMAGATVTAVPLDRWLLGLD